MAHAISKEETNYAGFINGYIAGNLTANSSELHSHTDKIIYYLNELKGEIDKWNLNDDAKSVYNNIFSKNILLTPISKYNSIDDYQTLGEGISDLISFILKEKPEPPSMVNFNLKKIIYHFLNIAKTTKDTSLVKQAKKITEKFPSEW